MKKLYVFLSVLVLSACGGGSSSSGGGVANGTPGPTKYAGTYRGSMVVSVFFEGQTEAQTQGIMMKIANDGQVTIDSGPANGVVCVTPPPTYINGSVIPVNGSGRCFTPGLGVCDINFKGSIQMSGISGIGKAEGKMKCGFGTVKFGYDIGVTRV